MKNRNIQFKPTLGLLILGLLAALGFHRWCKLRAPTRRCHSRLQQWGRDWRAGGPYHGGWNTGTGYQALHRLTVGNQNTATGFRALFSDTSGYFNTATGAGALLSNTTGGVNTATGYQALYTNNGWGNTANGYQALYHNISADDNTAIGSEALYSNTTNEGNTATGRRALYSNTGASNTATGAGALYSNTTGDDNTAVGAERALSQYRRGKQPSVAMRFLRTLLVTKTWPSVTRPSLLIQSTTTQRLLDMARSTGSTADETRLSATMRSGMSRPAKQHGHRFWSRGSSHHGQ